MSRYSARAIVSVCLFMIAGRFSAAEVSRSLISIPAPEVLAHGSVALSVDGRFFLDPPDLPDDQMAAWGPMARFGVGVLGRFEAGIEMVSAFESLDNASAYVRILALEEGKYRPAIGVGIFDMGYDKTPSMDVAVPVIGPIYLDENATNNSAYFVLAKTVPELRGVPARARLYFGNGRGRFRARGGKAEALYGTFFGGEVRFSSMRFTSELDGRFLYVGLGMDSPRFKGRGFEIQITGMVQGRYLEHARDRAKRANLSPALGGRLEVVLVPMPGSDIGKKKPEKKKPVNKPIIIRQY